MLQKRNGATSPKATRLAALQAARSRKLLRWRIGLRLRLHDLAARDIYHELRELVRVPWTFGALGCHAWSMARGARRSTQDRLGLNSGRFKLRHYPSVMSVAAGEVMVYRGILG